MGLIAFDPSAIADRATYEKPELLSTGMKYVIVNGRLAVDNGKYTGILGGHTLRRQQDFTKKSHLHRSDCPPSFSTNSRK
jgi:N-acyl-D-aspartate/D-glutamate deacylase